MTDTPAPASPAATEMAPEVTALANQMSSILCEMDDRTSPEDWPEAMLVTADEMPGIVEMALDRRDFALIPTPDLAALRAERDRLREALAALVKSLDNLIGDSHGVYGLHLNGDPSPWSELTQGGRYEEWLLDLEIARAALAEGRADGW